MRNNSKGFTLIEVLIAGSIMFIVLVMVTDSFLTARNSSRHANNVIAMLEPVQLIREDIRGKLMLVPGQHTTGEGRAGNVQFRWDATVEKQAAPPPRYELETDTTAMFKERFFLYNVNVVLSIDEQERIFSYKEFVWRENVGVPL